jgi:lipopolysaccharide biosynthesis glycosyltransferase
MPLCVMLASLVANFDPERELVIHIISNEATAKDREKVRRTIEMNRPGLEQVEIHWHAADLSLLKGVRESEHSRYSVDAYVRLLMPLVLPEDCKRVIYLDSDVVVLADLSALYDSTAGGRSVIHAVQDFVTPRVSSTFGVFDYAERGIPSDTRYFNSGIMVVDLSLWRERNLTPQLIDYMARNGDRVHAVDQGALNAFLHHDWTAIDPRWNQGPDVLFPEIWDAAGYSREEWQRTKNHPYIVHFSGHKKPWHKGRRGPRYSYFFQYVDRTVFKDDFPRRPRLEGIIGLRAYYHCWRIARNLLPGLVRK